MFLFDIVDISFLEIVKWSFAFLPLFRFTFFVGRFIVCALDDLRMFCNVENAFASAIICNNASFDISLFAHPGCVSINLVISV